MITDPHLVYPQIAHMCDTLLTGMKNVRDRTIIGNPNGSTINGDVDGQLCIISRTNSQQFAEAVNATSPASVAYWTNRAGEDGSGDSIHPKIGFVGNDERRDFFGQVRGRVVDLLVFPVAFFSNPNNMMH